MASLRTPDDVDLQIVDALRADPQVTNKAIAGLIGVSETTVAYRIRAMSDENIMRVVAQRDIFSDQYALMCFTYIDTSGRKVGKVAQEIAAIEEVTSVSLGIGGPELFVNMRATDRTHLQSLIAEKIGRVKGVLRVRTDICLKIEKFVSGFGDLSTDIPKTAFPNGTNNKDEHIISLLLADGRMSNREIARRLDISEGNVRQRLRKLDESNVMRLGVVCDGARLGVGAVANIRITIIPSKFSRAFAALSELESIAFLAATTGEFNVTAFAQSADQQLLAEICDDRIRSVDGVFDVKVQPLVHTYKHRYDLVRIK